MQTIASSARRALSSATTWPKTTRLAAEFDGIRNDGQIRSKDIADMVRIGVDVNEFLFWLGRVREAIALCRHVSKAGTDGKGEVGIAEFFNH